MVINIYEFYMTKVRVSPQTGALHVGEHWYWETWDKHGWESLLTKKSETWIQIQRYVEMMPFVLFGNPWGYRFPCSGKQYQKHKRSWPMSRISLFVEKNIDWFLNQADIKSLNSAKSMNNLIRAHSLWTEQKVINVIQTYLSLFFPNIQILFLHI